MTRFACFRRTFSAGIIGLKAYCFDNFGYYRHKYRIQYAEKPIADGNLYATGFDR